MTAVVGQQKELLKKKGDNVYLPCTNVRRCDQIQWWFKAPWNPLLEQIPLPAPGSTLSNRKMLQEDCTLVLLGVQEVDAGYYMCTVMELEVVQIYLAVLTSKYHSGLMDAREPVFIPSSVRDTAVRGCTLRSRRQKSAIRSEAQCCRAKLLLFYSSRRLLETI